MRSILALLLSLPIYYTVGLNHWGTYICIIGLQLLAGIDAKLRN
jgi:hypothetical protein